MPNVITTRILFQPANGVHAGPPKPWLCPLPRLDGALPCIISSTGHSCEDGLSQLGYRERMSSPEFVPVFAPTDGAVTYAARAGNGGALCLDHADGWSTSYSGLDTVLVPSRDRCSGRRKPRLRGGDVLGYLRGALRLGFGLSRWKNGGWTTANPADCLQDWTVQPWFTAPTTGARAALAI
jgi:hypothetical protein